jgi:arylsulfatase A-like enzyme
MEKRGYRTAAFSANFFYFSRNHGFDHGFSHFEEFEQTVGGILEKVTLSKMIFTALSRVTTGEQFAFFGVKNAPSAEKIDEDTMDWIERGHRPFFAVLNFIDAHEPVLPPEPYLHMYTSNPKARNQSLYFPEKCAVSGIKRLCDPNKQQFIDTYDGSIRYVDDNIQHLLSQLNERGLLANTIVVFTADHGQEFGDHGIYGHGKSLYRGEVHVPLVIWKPGLVPASVRVSTPVSLIDLPATILDLAGSEDEQALPGHSLAALWHTDQPISTWPAPFSEVAKLHWFSEEAPNYNGPIQSVVTPEWHYIRQEGKDLLFDWKSDPDEAHDQCAAQSAVCAALHARAQAAEGTRPQAN